MLFLRALEWAFGAFIIAFVLWQIVGPLLMGKLPFPAFREDKATQNKKEKSGE